MVSIRIIKTNDPLRETWTYLRLFSNESYVSKLVKEEKIKDEIVSCIRQAEEIYNLAKSSSVLTKPILLFYGMQRLAKALIFLKNPEVDINDLRNHGLSGGGISDQIEKFWDNKITKTKKGIFPEFSRWTTKNNVLFQATIYGEDDTHYTNYFVHQSDISGFLNSSEFKIYDLFSLVPELYDLFYIFKMENKLLIHCHFAFRVHPDNKIDELLNIQKKLELDSLKTRFPSIGIFTSFKEQPNQFTISSKRIDEEIFPDPLVETELNETYLIASPSNANNISDLNVHYVLMFLLNHIARYKTRLYTQMMSSKEKSEPITFIQKILEVTEHKFPKLILDQLLEEYFLFV